MFESETCHNFEYTTTHELFELFDAIKLLWLVKMEKSIALARLCSALNEAIAHSPHGNELLIALEDLTYELNSIKLDESSINIQLSNIESLKNLEWGI